MKKRNFISALAVLLAFSFLLAACAKPQTEYFAMTAEKDAYAPGEEIAVCVTLNNVENVALFDLNVTYDPDLLTLSEAVEGDVKDFILMANPQSDAVLIKGFTATTYDFTSEEIVTLYFTVNEGASGKIKLQAEATMFQIGTDDSGDEIEDILGDKKIACSLTFNVAG